LAYKYYSISQNALQKFIDIKLLQPAPSADAPIKLVLI
jgi:hypothetical protein